MIDAPEGTPWWAWFVLALLMGVVIPIYKFTKDQRKRDQTISQSVAKIDHQVSNEHDTNLRDDFDKVMSMAERSAEASEKALEIAERLESAHAETRRDIGGLRDEQRGVRSDHRLLVKRLDDHMTRDRGEPR